MQIIKRNIRHLLLFLFHLLKHRHRVKFCYTTDMSHLCEFEGMNALGKKSSFCGRMGYGSYMGANCHLSAYIGRFTSIGGNVSQIIETHAYKFPSATTSQLFYSIKSPVGFSFSNQNLIEEYRYYDKDKQIAVKIGNDCWIGNDIRIIGGVEIGDGAVVLTRAIVTKDVPPYAIVGGIPAKVIGYRYDEETILFLQKIRWWNNSIEWFKENWSLLNDINKLKEYYRKQ